MGPLVTAVQEALDDAAAPGKDLAAAALALKYAAEIDDGGDVKALGPLLLAVLDSLLMTPRSRAASNPGRGGDSDGRPTNPLDELRNRRNARVNHAPAVDSPAP